MQLASNPCSHSFKGLDKLRRWHRPYPHPKQRGKTQGPTPEQMSIHTCRSKVALGIRPTWTDPHTHAVITGVAVSIPLGLTKCLAVSTVNQAGGIAAHKAGATAPCNPVGCRKPCMRCMCCMCHTCRTRTCSPNHWPCTASVDHACSHSTQQFRPHNQCKYTGVVQAFHTATLCMPCTSVARSTIVCHSHCRAAGQQCCCVWHTHMHTNVVA